MKFATALMALFTLALPALAADIARDPDMVVEGSVTHHEDVIVRGDVAQVNILDDTFTDLSSYWASGFLDAGFYPDIYYDPMGGVDYGNYQFLCVDCSDNWWYSMNYPMEPQAWRSYLDGGGNMILIGQDFLYGSGDLDLLTHYFGVQSVAEDVNYDDFGTLTWSGTAGGPLSGYSGSMEPCFAANYWFTDDVTPAGNFAGVATWSSPAYANGEAGAATWNGIFSTVEFGCGSVDVVWIMVYQWFGYIVATENVSIGAVKALYE